MKAFVIHLAKAVERLPLIENLKTIFNNLEIYDANDGTEWQADQRIQKAHPWTKIPVTQGNIGCTRSHIDLIQAALKAGVESIMIFEDDCDFKPVDTATMMKFIEGAPPYDILLLGATEYVESEEAGQYKKVGRFWGAHALILKERGMRAALKAFADSQKRGDFLPGDWLYNEAIKEGLVCYGPADPFHFCRQKEGLLSYLTGTIRKYRKVP